MSPNDPPAYSTVIDTPNPAANLRTAKLPHFYLDGTLIFPSSPPSRATYVLNSPPCEAKSASYEVRKIIYKLSPQGAVRSRVERIYGFRPFRMPSFLINGRRRMLIDGLGRAQVDQVEMVPAWHGEAEWRVEGYFRLRQVGRDKWKKRRELRWEDMEGRVLAVEERVQRDQAGRVVGLPELELRVEMEEKMVDLLVTCWSARLWKESLNAMS